MKGQKKKKAYRLKRVDALKSNGYVQRGGQKCQGEAKGD